MIYEYLVKGIKLCGVHLSVNKYVIGPWSLLCLSFILGDVKRIKQAYSPSNTKTPNKWIASTTSQKVAEHSFWVELGQNTIWKPILYL